MLAVSNRLINLLYPPACFLCCHPLSSGDDPAQDAQERAGLCNSCLSALPRHEPPFCSRCGIELSGAFDAVLVCARCRTASPAFASASAPWRYAGAMRPLIHRLKYRRSWRLGAWCADTMVAAAQKTLPLDTIDLVLPVPLHPLKRWVKGGNPAEELAVAVARALRKPCRSHALRRVRWTVSQTRLRGAARIRNVQRAFRVDPRAVNAQAVLLVDDVLTSGATANACAAALRAAGARAIYVLAAARTPLP